MEDTGVALESCAQSGDVTQQTSYLDSQATAPSAQSEIRHSLSPYSCLAPFPPLVSL